MKAKRIIAGLLILSLTAATACIDENSVFAPVATPDSSGPAAIIEDYTKMTAEEIVAASLKRLQMVQPATVKIVSQKDINKKGVLSEFAIELAFAPPASAGASVKKSAKKRKGGRK